MLANQVLLPAEPPPRTLGVGGDFPTEVGRWVLTMGTIPHAVVLD